MALRWYEAVRDALMMAAMLASICLSWPQLGRGLVLTTKIVVLLPVAPIAGRRERRLSGRL